jgi:hypothetical protein
MSLCVTRDAALIPRGTVAVSMLKVISARVGVSAQWTVMRVCGIQLLRSQHRQPAAVTPCVRPELLQQASTDGVVRAVVAASMTVASPCVLGLVAGTGAGQASGVGAVGQPAAVAKAGAKRHEVTLLPPAAAVSPWPWPTSGAPGRTVPVARPGVPHRSGRSPESGYDEGPRFRKGLVVV